MFQMSDEYLHKEELESQRAQDVVSKVKESGIIKAIKQAETSEITILSRFIVVVAIVADLFGLIPIAGNFFGLVFGVVLIILYFFDGLGRGFLRGKIRKLIKTWILRLVLYTIEVLALGFSWLPLFTIAALIHYYSLKKGYYKKMEKVNEKIEQIKKALK